jgi:hypothetical protein
MLTASLLQKDCKSRTEEIILLVATPTRAELFLISEELLAKLQSCIS